jgi:hypothetical protein
VRVSTKSGSASAFALGLAAMISVAVLAKPPAEQDGKAANVSTASGSHTTAIAKGVVERGRYLAITHDCGGCHGGADPASKDWLAGMTSRQQEFMIGPCYVTPGATPCFRTRPRNLTPDNMTGLGRFTERQIFNALRYGLRPEDTPDVEITSATPGKGEFPLHPHYLAPPMPWPAWRHMPDSDLMAIAAYLKYGLKPVRNKVADSEGPPDFWASEYTVEKIGAYPTPRFPTANEQAPRTAERP